MSNDSSFEEHLKRVLTHLQHEDKSMRQRAIHWLAKSGRADVVKPLEWTAKSDPDPEIREYAQKAVQYIQKQTQAMPKITVDETLKTMETPAVRVDNDPTERARPQSLSDLRKTGELRAVIDDEQPRQKRATGSLSDGETKRGTGSLLEIATRRGTGSLVSETNQAENKQSQSKNGGVYFTSQEEELSTIIEGYETYAYQDPNSPDYVPREDWEMSRSLIAQAYNDFLYDKSIAGIRKLARAFELDPKSIEEEAANKAVVALMDEMSFGQAIEIITNPTQLEVYIINRRKRDRHGLEVNTTWGRVIVDLFLFAIIQVVGIGALLFIMQNRIVLLRERLLANPDYALQIRLGEDVAASYTAFHAVLSPYAINNFVMIGVSVGLTLTLAVSLGHLASHMTAKLMSGNGRLTDTLVNLNETPLWVTLAMYAMGLAVVYLFFPTSYSQLDSGQVIALYVFIGLLIIPVLLIAFQQGTKLAHLHEISVPIGFLTFAVNSFIVVGTLAVFWYLTPMFQIFKQMLGLA